MLLIKNCWLSEKFECVDCDQMAIVFENNQQFFKKHYIKNKMKKEKQMFLWDFLFHNLKEKMLFFNSFQKNINIIATTIIMKRMFL